MLTHRQFKDRLNHINKEIKQIRDNDDNDTLETILDSYEFDKHCYDFITNKDDNYFKLFFSLVEMKLKETKYDLDLSFNELKEYDNKNKSYKSFLNYVVDNLNYGIDEDIDSDSDNDSDNDDSDYNNSDDENVNNDQLDDITQKELMKDAKYKELRENQKLARENNIKQNFCSGIHNQVTGAGKSIIMLLTINDHYQKELNNKNNQNKLNNLYIITCPRIEVLNKMFFEKNKDGDGFIINKENEKFWKDSNIIDLKQYKIIDAINYTYKKIKLDPDKPNMLIVNSDYFKIMDEKKMIDYNKVNFVIFDECHGVSAKKFYDLLYQIKFVHKKHIIGFSATPLRDNAEDKVKKIFSSSLNKNDKHMLNIISNYDMMNAICHNVVLPPLYTIVEIKKTCKKKIGKSNKDITEKVIKNKLPELPYKKIICWCGTIPKMKEWYIFFKKRFPELKLYCSTSKDNEHSKENYNTNFDKFCEAEKDCVLLCVNRCREGSDIKNLDCGIYIDHVKKRGILVCIQTVGRILRPDKEKQKKCGNIIDTFINDGKIEIEVMTAKRVISYYEKVLGLASEESCKEMLETYTKMKEIFSDANTTFDNKTNKIKIKIDSDEKHDTEINLELTTKNFDWSKFKEKLSGIIDKKFGIDEEISLKTEFNILKETLQKHKIKNKNEYKQYALKNGFVIDPETKYINSGWTNYYDFLGINTDDFPKTLDELKIKCKNHELNNQDIYIAKCHKFKLPEMPEEIYLNFTSFYNLFNNQTNKRRA